eukprot:3941106-Rhodomonas_salina.1
MRGVDFGRGCMGQAQRAAHVMQASPLPNALPFLYAVSGANIPHAMQCALLALPMLSREPQRVLYTALDCHSVCRTMRSTAMARAIQRAPQCAVLTHELACAHTWY